MKTEPAAQAWGTFAPIYCTGKFDSLRVQLGELLAEIDPRSLQAQVEQADAGVQQAKAQLGNAEADFQRKEELLKRGVSTHDVGP